MTNKAKTKDTQILNAAAKHFAINGFGGARVDEIAAEAGVNKATLYYRIGDKAAIYDHAIGRQDPHRVHHRDAPVLHLVRLDQGVLVRALDAHKDVAKIGRTHQLQELGLLSQVDRRLGAKVKRIAVVF